nr:protein NETWORKED 1A [Tanacetum cinerariifolium]
MPTKELILEQSQQGVSNDVLKDNMEKPAFEVEGEGRDLMNKLSRLESKNDAGLLRYGKCLEKKSALKKKIVVTEDEDRTYSQQVVAQAEMKIVKLKKCSFGVNRRERSVTAIMLLKSFDTEQYILFPVMSQLYKDDLILFQIKRFVAGLERNLPRVQTPVSTDMLGRKFNGFGNRSIQAKAYQAIMLLKSFDTEQYILFPVMSQLYKDDLILFQIKRFVAGLERNLPRRLFGWRIIRGLAMFLWLAVIATKIHDLALEMRKWEVRFRLPFLRICLAANLTVLGIARFRQRLIKVNPDDIELGGWDISIMNLADAIAGAMALDIMRFMSSSISIQKPTV